MTHPGSPRPEQDMFQHPAPPLGSLLLGTGEASSPWAGCGRSEPPRLQEGPGWTAACPGQNIWRAYVALVDSVVVFVVAGSSTDISEDWEKDFDLDMTEEEVQLALSKVEVSGEVSCGELLTHTGVEVAARNPSVALGLVLHELCYCWVVPLGGEGRPQYPRERRLTPSV